MTDILESRFVMQRPGLIPWLTEARATLGLALPLIANQLTQIATGTTAVLMLGRFSKEALAASALGLTLYYFVWMIGGGPASSVSPMIAHARGQNPDDEMSVRIITRMGLWSVLITSPLAMIFLCFTESILRFLNQDPALAHAAGVFVIPMIFSVPFSLGFVVLRSYAAALEKPRSTFWVILGTLIVNVLFQYLLIFGHHGFPKLGLLGSGIASAISHLFSFTMMLGIIRMTPALHRFRIFKDFGRRSIAKLSEVFRLGLPISMIKTFEGTLFMSAALLVGVFGTASVAANQIALNIVSITFMVPMGIGMAATVRVGLAAGGGDTEGARRAGYTALMLSGLFMLTSGISLAFAAEPVLHIYIEDIPANAEVFAVAIVFMKIGAAFQILDGTQVTAALALQGLKDTRIPMWLTGFSYWLGGFPACWLLGYTFGLEGFGVWLGLAFGLLLAAASLTWRFYRLTRR